MARWGSQPVGKVTEVAGGNGLRLTELNCLIYDLAGPLVCSMTPTVYQARSASHVTLVILGPFNYFDIPGAVLHFWTPRLPSRADLVGLCVATQIARYCNRSYYVWMDKVPMVPPAAPVNKASPCQVRDQFSESLVANLISSKL